MLISILSSLCYGTMALCGGLALKTIFIDEDIEEETEEIQTTNILKYEYYPVESVIEENKDNKVLTYTFVEGEKEGVKACVGQDIENNFNDDVEGVVIWIL